MFDTAFEKTLKFEGGLSNDANDSGGLTKYGISQKSYPNIDIRKLTIKQAKDIYYIDYWIACKCDKIQNNKIAEQVFDIAVNHGTFGAGKIIQKAINNSAGRVVLKVDGAIGKLTIEALNFLDAQTINNNIVRYRARKYAEIVTKDKTQVCFLEGWLNRCMSYIF